MLYVAILVAILLVSAVGIGGYYIGRYQTALIDKIRTLEGQKREAPPEPEKPTVVMGAYSLPREISTVPEKKRSAGLVETKTPELLDWENSNEIAKLEHGG